MPSIESLPKEEIIVSPEQEFENKVGSLYKFLHDNIGPTSESPPYILYASGALKIMETHAGKKDPENRDPGDVDLFTSNEGIAKLYELLKDNAKKIDLRDVTFNQPSETIPLTHTENVAHMKCTFTLENREIALDVWSDLNDKGKFELRNGEAVDIKKDVTSVDVHFENMGKKEIIPVTMFNPEAMNKIYRQVEIKQRINEPDKVKPRSGSMERVQTINLSEQV
jgi:hypothetical protein